MTTYKLKPEIKERWLQRLRSKTIKQGKGQLRQSSQHPVTRMPEPDAFCCLGVLGQLAVEDGKANWDGLELQATESYSCLAMPRGLADWACDKEVVPLILETHPSEEDAFSFRVTTADGATSLDKLNDDGFTFEQIADIIEEQL
jgi:hypothetical protein